MIGLLIGVACAIGFAKVLRGHRRWHRGGYMHPAFVGGGCGGYGYGHERGFYEESLYDDERVSMRGPFGRGGPFGQGGPFGGAQHMIRGVFRRLRTTPEQETDILNAIDELRSAGRDAKGEMREAAKDTATALRGEVFSEEAVGGATAAFEHTLDKMRKASIAAFAKIHGTLDTRQRGELADLIERGASWR